MATAPAVVGAAVVLSALSLHWLFLFTVLGCGVVLSALYTRFPPDVRPLIQRCIAGIAIGVLVSVWATFLTMWLRPPAAAALPWESVTSATGVLVSDVRSRADGRNSAVLRLTSVTNKDGWRASAGGVIDFYWSGGGSLVRNGDTRRVLPIRGDQLTVRDISLDTSGERAFSHADHIVMATATSPRSAHELRRRARAVIRSRLGRLEADAAAITEALLLGDRAMLSTEQIETFRRAGAAHVIALSGMHLGIIALLLSRVIRSFAPARVGNGLLLASLVAYVWVAGWIASLVRALVLVLVAAGARARHRTIPGPVLLARAVLVCTVIVPGIGSDLGFQFSVAALGGLMILSGPMVSWFSRVMPRSVAQYAAPSAAAMVATAPIALATFGVVYPVGVISAGVLGLLVMAVVIAAIALLLGAAIPIVGTALVWLVERLVSILTGSAALAARAPAWEPPLGLRDIMLVVAIAAVCVAVAAGVWRVVLFRVRRRQREPQFYF